MDETFDWTTCGFRPRYRDQKNQPLCSMMSTCACIEGMWFAKHGQRIDLSEQQVLDSLKAEKFNEVTGVKRVDWQDLMKMFRLTTEENYPSTNKGNGYIKQNLDWEEAERTPFVLVKEMKRIVKQNGKSMEETMREMVKKHPIIGCMSINPDIRKYKQGIYGNGINHFMVIVGFGVETKTDIDTGKITREEYWIVLQSWGKEFGLDGYMHVRRGKNHCRVEEIAFYPVLGQLTR